MDITFTCKKCGQNIVTDDAGMGLEAKCPTCREALTIPVILPRIEVERKEQNPSEWKIALIYSVSSIAAAVVAGIIYATGYLVESTFLGALGVTEYSGDAFKAKYVYVGLLCLAFPISTILIVGCFRRLQKSATAWLATAPEDAPEKADIEMFKSISWAHKALTLLFILNFYMLVTFWRLQFLSALHRFFDLHAHGLWIWYRSKGISVDFENEAFAFLGYLPYLLMIFSRLRQQHLIVVRKESTKAYAIQPQDGEDKKERLGSLGARLSSWCKSDRALYQFNIGLVVFSGIYSFVLCYCTYQEAQHTGSFILGLVLCAMPLFIGSIILWRIGYFLKACRKTQMHIPLLIACGCLIVVFLYLYVLAFSYRLYPYISAGRGGGDYTTESDSVLTFETDRTKLFPDILLAKKESRLPVVSKPVVVLSESSEAIIVAIPCFYATADGIATNGPSEWRVLPAQAPKLIFLIKRDAILSIQRLVDRVGTNLFYIEYLPDGESLDRHTS